MNTIDIIDPNTGQAHAIPYDKVPHALKAGGEFANDSQKQKAINIQNGTYSEENNASSERTGLIGVLSDLASGAGNAYNQGMKFAVNLPENLEKSGQYLEKNPAIGPLHILGQAGAEASELGKSLINAPYNLNQYLARKHLLPQVLGKLGKFIPHIPEETGLEKALGLEENSEKGDVLYRAIPDLTMVGSLAKHLGQGLKKSFKAPDLKQAIRDTQVKVNEAKNEAGKIFDRIESEVEERGISQVPVDTDILKNAESMLPKTQSTKNLIEEAKKGDFKALRTLQADLRIIGEKHLSSKLGSEWNRGKEIIDTRDKLNKSIQDHFKNTNNLDLAEDLNSVRNKYKDIQKTYFSTPTLTKVFGESQKVPRNPKTFLTEESAEMNRFFEAHPELPKILSKALKHESRGKAIKRTLGAAGLIEGVDLAKSLREKLFK